MDTKTQYSQNGFFPQIPISCLMDKDKLIIKLIKKGKRPIVVHTIQKKNKTGGPENTGFKTYYNGQLCISERTDN